MVRDLNNMGDEFNDQPMMPQRPLYHVEEAARYRDPQHPLSMVLNCILTSLALSWVYRPKKELTQMRLVSARLQT